MTTIATRRIVHPNGKVTNAPAHFAAPPRIRASDITRYGGLDAAKREIWGEGGKL